MLRRALLLASALPIASAAVAQADPPLPPSDPAASEAPIDPTDEFEGDDEAPIVIQGTRPRGSVIGDIEPLDVLDSRDVRATGATNISEVLEAIAPQIGSAQGRGGERPVLLLNGKKISGFRELRDIPAEAIERVDILPEEVALKYGYGADQKVVNFVLRERFRSTAASLAGEAATAGGYAGGTGDLTRLLIRRDQRTSLNLRAEGNGLLSEDERSIDLTAPIVGVDPSDQLAARSLIGSKRLVRATATHSRPLTDDIAATVNGEVEHSTGRSLLGLGSALIEPLQRRTTSDSAHAGFVLNGTKADWQWSLVGNGDLARSRTSSDRDNALFPVDRSRGTTATADLTATANGKLFVLPAGDARTSITLAGDTARLRSKVDRGGVEDSASLKRTTGRIAANVDLPISRRNRDFDALGNLTLSFNGEVRQLSDFGTLTKVGADVVASPVDRLNLIASWSRAEGAPSIAQLGDPILETPDARVFDFTTGETAVVTAITGGNPDLRADRRTVTKLGVNWQPIEKIDLRFRADYVRSRIDQPVQSIFGPTPTLEAAFPDRFVRDSDGRLVSVDFRPINFDEARKDTLRFGFDFTKPLKSRQPSQAVRDQMRAQLRGDRGGRDSPQTPRPDGDASPPPPSGEGSERAPAEARGGGRGWGGGRFGGGNRGRLTFSITDTLTFVDQVSIGPGLPIIDYRRGDAAGAGGGTPRHQVEAQAGWANNGLGARLSANWRSGTTVRSRAGDDLRFAPLGTLDLRLFANLGEQPELVLKHPWLRGTSLRFEVKNILDNKPKVRDEAGGIPANYQSDLLDPLGRTVKLTLRKLFLPSFASMRQEFRGDRGAGDAR